MTDFLTRLSRTWWEWAGAASWQLALLVALVALAALASRRLSARFRYLLWMLVVIKALMPPSLGAAWSIGNWASPLFWRAASVKATNDFRALDPSTLGVQPDSSAPASAAQGLWLKNGDVSTIDSTISPSPATPRSIIAPASATDVSSWSVSGVALAVWLFGLVALAMFIVLRYWRLTRALARASEVDEGPLRVTLERLAMRVGRRDPPALLLSDAVSSPFLFGLLRPRIVLPACLPETLSPDQLEDVLLHELTHWRRRDLVAGWLQILVQTLFWFHPLVWLAGAQLRHERECACDEEALESGCSQARRYGESLLRVLLAARGRSAVAMGFLGIFERNTRLQRRLEEIMNQENNVRRFGIWSWLSLIIFAAACLPMAARSDTSQIKTPLDSVSALAAENLAAEGWRLWRERKLPEAEARFKEAVTKDPNNANAWNGLGWAQQNQGKPFNAKESFERCTSLNPKHAAALNGLGWIAKSQGKPDEAIGWWEKAVEASPQATAAVSGLASTWLERGDKEKAAKYYKMWLQAEPNSAEAKAGLEKTGKGNTQSQVQGPPKILSVSPAIGATDVDPATREITVTFDRDMGGGMSWTGGGQQFPPIPEGERGSWRDKRTCVLPVKLEPGHFYRVGINSTSFQNFRGADGVPAEPSAIYFTTRGAKRLGIFPGKKGSKELKDLTQKPEVVMMEPANGAAGVDPNLKELRVTFNVPMGGGFSWTGGGPNFPTIPQGQRPRWSEDRKTCILPVALKPNWEYRLGLNSPSYKNFQSAGGVPLEPVEYSFKTRP